MIFCLSVMVVFGTGCRGCRVKWPLNEHSLWISVCYELLEGAITRLCAPGTSVLHQVCWSQRRPGTRSPRHQGSKWVGTHGSAVFRSDISTIWRFQASKERSLPWEQAGKNLNRNVFFIYCYCIWLAGRNVLTPFYTLRFNGHFSRWTWVSRLLP